MPTTENTDPGRIRSGGDRVFGIRMTLPDGDPFRLVLGTEWTSFRWYASSKERDNAYEDMRHEHRFSRLGDAPALVYEKVERDKPAAPTHHPAA